MNKLPPLNISLVSDVPYWEASEKPQHLRKIDYVISKAFLIFRDDHIPFEKLSERPIGRNCFHSYVAKGKTSDPILQALSEDDDEDQEQSIQAEYLIFLFRRPELTPTHQQVFVLSTKRAYKVIRPYCSQHFSMNLSPHLAQALIRVERVTTGQLLGPVSDTHLHMQGSLPITIEQRNLVYREFTATLQSVATIEGNNIKVKFKEKGILIYRDFSLDQYVEIVDHLAENIVVETPTTPSWGIPDLPEGGMHKITDLTMIKDLNLCLAAFITEDESVHSHEFNFRFSNRWYTNADQYKMSCTEYATESKGGKHSFLIEFSDSYSSPQLADIRKTLKAAYSRYWAFNKKYIQNVIERSEITIDYRLNGEFWYGHPLLDCMEGVLNNQAGQVYFKMGSFWYQVQEAYVTQVNETFPKIVTPSLLCRGEAGYLHLAWYKDDKTYAINKKEFDRINRKLSLNMNYTQFVNHFTPKNHIQTFQRRGKPIQIASAPVVVQSSFDTVLNIFYTRRFQMNEEAYNASYAKLANQVETTWFEGNRQLLSKIELFDILCFKQGKTYIYHVKKEFDHTMRDAASQLIMSAQAIRNILDKGDHNIPTSEFTTFCRSIAREKTTQLLNAFLVKNRKDIHFVLAFSLGLGDPLHTMSSSHSLIAKREIIKLKEEIENLGFSFKISPIEEAFEHPLTCRPYAKQVAYNQTRELLTGLGYTIPNHLNDTVNQSILNHQFILVLRQFGVIDFESFSGPHHSTLYCSRQRDDVLLFDGNKVWHCHPLQF